MSATTVTTTDLEIVVTRAFDAPRALVFQAWTNPEFVPNWMIGPGQWTMTVCRIDLRAGGAWHFAWRHDDGAEMSMSGVYQEVAAPGRLVSAERWSGDWPETLNTLVLAEEDGRTTITNTIRFPSTEARDAALRTGMKQGMSRSYEQLDQFLARVK